MLDTKVTSALTDSSSRRCYVCGAKPKEMNYLDLIQSLSVKEENLKYGLSVLHAWIKLLECILHIIYKLEYKKTRLYKADENASEEVENIENIENDSWFVKFNFF